MRTQPTPRRATQWCACTLAVLMLAAPVLGAGDRLDLLVHSLRTERDKKYLKGVHDALVGAGASAVPAVMELLKHENADVRMRAAAVLTEIGDSRARQAMTDLLDDPDERVRGVAIKAAGVLQSQTAIGKLLAPLPDNDGDSYRRAVRATVCSIGAACAPALTEMLGHADVNVVVWALGCLGEIGAAEPNVLDRLFAGTDLQVRLACVDAAAEAGHEALLAKALKDAHWAVRRHAAHGLGRAGGAELAGLQEMAESDPEPRVRREALVALARVGGAGAGALLEKVAADIQHPDREAAVTALGVHASPGGTPVLLTALRGGDASLRRRAACALGKSAGEGGDRVGTDALAGLIAALGDDDSSVRAAARTALTALPGDAAMAAIAHEMATTERHHLARELSLSLAAMGPRAEPALTAMLETTGENVRGLAVEALGTMGATACLPTLVSLLAEGGPLGQSCGVALSDIGRPAAPLLVEALADPRPELAGRAREVLGSMPGTELAELLVEALGDESPAVRGAAAEILGERKETLAVPNLIWTVGNDPDMTVRVAAAASLGRVGNRLATGPLMRASRHADAGLRREAAEALGQLGDAAAFPALEKLIEQDEDAQVVGAAERALDRLRNAGE